ncbi:hypothetical protein [Janthinobacterium sp. HLX7-2]|uniref:hypothetical protein n=1 Tax=Janthinobacterium sp. HLX7-2 TaxID=1259331 RepID=UPI003F26050E
MKKSWALALGAIIAFSLAYAEGSSGWGEYRPLKGSYLIYSRLGRGAATQPTQVKTFQQFF